VFKDPEAGTTKACTAGCVLGDTQACGSSAFACTWPADPAAQQNGAQGQCMQLCGCEGGIAEECAPPFVCVELSSASWLDPTVQSALQQIATGFCAPAEGPNGEAVTIIPGGC
jgi:hypothetical protein